LNKALVAYGWVVAFRHYSQAYVADETGARAERQGILRSTFELPEDFRHSKQLTRRGAGSSSARGSLAKADTRGSCVIKGNRNRRGEWIYHVPGVPYYGVTRAEELFCTEAQVQAAGIGELSSARLDASKGLRSGASSSVLGRAARSQSRP
jgi:hypothetical protein